MRLRLQLSVASDERCEYASHRLTEVQSEYSKAPRAAVVLGSGLAGASTDYQPEAAVRFGDVDPNSGTGLEMQVIAAESRAAVLEIKNAAIEALMAANAPAESIGRLRAIGGGRS